MRREIIITRKLSLRRRWLRFRNWWTGGPDSPWVAVKWKITRWIDRRHPDWCWCHLVDWALGFDTFDATIANAPGTESCRRDAEQSGRCYCGRFENAAAEGEATK